MSKVRVLIVDDSSIIRTLLNRFISQDPDCEVVGSAPDPYYARDLLVKLKPDVMTLDIEMPKMDGITFLEKVMNHFPTRTLIISSLSTKGSALALQALDFGAVDVMAKPAIDVTKSMESVAKEVVDRIKQVARAKMPLPRKFVQANRFVEKSSAKLALAKTTHQVLAIASSTGGTQALKELMPLLPGDLPGTVIVQHMPPVFTKTFADSLDKLCPFEVREAQDGDKVLPGNVLIAPGNYHMEIVRSGGYYHIKLHQEPTLHGVRPAADYLMRSVAKHAGANAMGVVLTGMGRDGADGLKIMRDAGAYTVVQNEASCVVYGMPKVALETGGAEQALSLPEIASELITQFKKRS